MITMSADIVPLLHGINASMRTGLKARELGITKAMVVYDAGVYNAGIVEPVIDNLKAARINVVQFDKVIPDPPDYIMNEGGELANSEKIDGIIAIGGGSPMDTAKAINMLTANPAPINQWFFPSQPQGEPLPMIALPTTAGTGSESSFAAVVTDSATGIKGALLDAKFCKFSLIIQDPRLYAGLSAKFSAYVAFDILAHSIDSLYSPYGEVYAYLFAENAIRKVIKYLPKVLKDNGDLEARAEIAFAATLGGNVLNTNMAGNTHTIGHSLGAICHIPHSLAVALSISSLIEMHYCRWNPEKTRLIGECFGVEFSGCETPEEIGKLTAAAIHEFYLQCGIETLSRLNLDKEKIEQAVAIMPNDMQTPSTYVLLSRSQYQEIIERMLAL